jgi:hypothetical protein
LIENELRRGFREARGTGDQTHCQNDPQQSQQCKTWVMPLAL